MSAERFRESAAEIMRDVHSAYDYGAVSGPGAEEVEARIAAALAEAVATERREIREAIQKQIDTGSTLEEWEEEPGLKTALELIDARPQ